MQVKRVNKLKDIMDVHSGDTSPSTHLDCSNPLRSMNTFITPPIPKGKFGEAMLSQNDLMIANFCEGAESQPGS